MFVTTLRSSCSLLLFTAALAGCASEGSAPVDVADSLERTAGCGDAVLVASNPTDSLALIIEVQGIVAQAHDVHDVVTFVYDVEDDGIRVEMVEGTDVSTTACSDDERAVVDDVFLPTSGEIELNVTPQGEPGDKAGFGARVDLVLRDMLFEDSVGAATTIGLLDRDVVVRSLAR